MNLSRVAISTIFLVNGFILANWVSRLPRVQEIYGMDHGTLGLILLTLASGAVIAMPFTGWVIYKFGSRKITSVASVFYCMVVPLVPLFPNLIVMGIVFFFIGMMIGTMDVAMNAQAVLVEQNMKKPIMSSFHAIFSAGMMLGAGSGALFVQLGFDLPAHLIIVATFALCLVLLSLGHFVPDPRQEKSKDDDALFHLPTKALWSIGLIAFCCMLGEGAMSDWSANYMKQIIHASEALAPLALAAFSTAMMSGRFIGDWVRAKVGDRRLMIFASLIALTGMMIILSGSNEWIVISGFFIVGLGLSTIVPIAYSIAGNTPGLASGVGISMVTTIGYTGFLFGPPIIGFVADRWNLWVALFIVLGLFALMFCLSYFRGRKVVF